MFGKSFAKNLLRKPTTMMAAPSMATRGVYTDATRPYVFINQHTKVICQGMTGKHVSFTVSSLGRGKSWRPFLTRLFLDSIGHVPH